jgi:hypothetical protein
MISGEIMRIMRCGVVLALGLLLAACATNTHKQITELSRTQDRAPRVLLMPVDVELMELTTFGRTEPKADWTDAATKHVSTALADYNQERELHFVAFDLDKMPDGVRDELNQLIKLHGAVGNSILVHQYLEPAKLPSKQGKFDWSLGPQVKRLKEATDADYALFVFMRDSYSSGGRVAIMMVGALMGVAVQGGVQVGFASLVDLNDGNVVWFNRLMRPQGDLRSAQGAKESATMLLTGLPK